MILGKRARWPEFREEKSSMTDENMMSCLFGSAKSREKNTLPLRRQRAWGFFGKLV